MSVDSIRAWESKARDLEQAIHDSIVGEQRLYEAMRENFYASLEDADIGVTHTTAVRRGMKHRRDELTAARTTA